MTDTPMSPSGSNRLPRPRARGLSNEHRDFEAELAAARLAQTLDSGTKLPTAPVEHTRVSELIAYLGSKWGFTPTPVTVDDSLPLLDQARKVIEAAQVRVRPLTLESQWWQENVPPMIVKDEAGLALVLPGPLLRPMLHRPGMQPKPVTDDLAAGIELAALEVIRPLPDGVLGMRELITFTLRGTSRDILLVALPAVLAGAITLAVPLATAALFSEIVPTGNTGRLIAIAIALLGLGVATAILTYVRVYHVIRVSDHVLALSTAAIFDRILRIPVSHLRDWPSSRLSGRIIIGNTVSNAIDSALSVALVSSAIVLLNGVLLVILIPPLGVVALLFGALLLLLGYLLARREGDANYVEKSDLSDVNRVLLDILRGWVPVRTSAGEISAFGRWAASYAQYREAFSRRWGVEITLEVLRISLLGASVIAFVLAAYLLPLGTITAGNFLAFVSAFGSFGIGLTGLLLTMRSMFQVRTDVLRLEPLLALPVESGSRREDPGPLEGKVEVRRLGFRYSPDMPWVLRDLTFTVEPGTFTAIVGTSGSGKSTLLRIMLGFDQPLTGAVLFDGADLASLDLGSVRRQFGVVLQSSLLLPGTLRDNITVASGPLPEERIEQLCEQVNLQGTIAALPQGLDTIIDEGSTLISGGQRQRVLLARALAANPAVLFLDEATSALDNVTQAAISQTIENLGVTRILIAHRLSTIRHADQIILLDHGRIVESGTYDALMASDGIFAELARRQEL
jgi:ABC-type bacteriocin/lantibiotic exporter with double-glycine peptidase domain